MWTRGAGITRGRAGRHENHAGKSLQEKALGSTALGGGSEGWGDKRAFQAIVHTWRSKTSHAANEPPGLFAASPSCCKQLVRGELGAAAAPRVVHSSAVLCGVKLVRIPCQTPAGIYQSQTYFQQDQCLSLHLLPAGAQRWLTGGMGSARLRSPYLGAASCLQLCCPPTLRTNRARSGTTEDAFPAVCLHPPSYCQAKESPAISFRTGASRQRPREISIF